MLVWECGGQPEAGPGPAVFSSKRNSAPGSFQREMPQERTSGSSVLHLCRETAKLPVERRAIRPAGGASGAGKGVRLLFLLFLKKNRFIWNRFLSGASGFVNPQTPKHWICFLCLEDTLVDVVVVITNDTVQVAKVTNQTFRKVSDPSHPSIEEIDLGHVVGGGGDITQVCTGTHIFVILLHQRFTHTDSQSCIPSVTYGTAWGVLCTHAHLQTGNLPFLGERSAHPSLGAWTGEVSQNHPQGASPSPDHPRLLPKPLLSGPSHHPQWPSLPHQPPQAGVMLPPHHTPWCFPVCYGSWLGPHEVWGGVEVRRAGCVYVLVHFFRSRIGMLL